MLNPGLVKEAAERFMPLNPMLADPNLRKVKQIGRQINELERRKVKIQKRIDALIEREKRFSKLAS